MSPLDGIHGDCATHGRWLKNPPHKWLTQCPACVRVERIKKRIDDANIPYRFRDSSFASFISTSSEQRRALEIAREYASNCDKLQAGVSLVFIGRLGTGKTHLATAIMRSVIESDICSARYATVGEIIRAVRSTWRRNSEKSEEQVIDRFACTGLLVLDEVGVQVGSDDERRILFEILDGRYREEMPTIVISNENVAGITTYIGERGMDRLRENGGRIVVFNWQSHRGCAGGSDVGVEHVDVAACRLPETACGS